MHACTVPRVRTVFQAQPWTSQGHRAVFQLVSLSHHD